MSKRLHLKAIRQRSVTGDLSEANRDPAAQIDRINDLIRTARTSWFGLLSYLAFVGVTLLGVEDADFFIAERQTALPLIGVSIPTLLFFWVAPTIGAALYTYFHLHLLKLYEALGQAERTDAPLSDRTLPWLVADFALAWRPGELSRRPMRWLALTTTLLLAYIAGPLVLAGFWYRSMPYHEEVLTIIGCGIPFMVGLYAGQQSWAYMIAQMRPDRPHRPLSHLLFGLLGGIVGCLVIALGWLTTEGTFEHYMRNFGYNEPITYDLETNEFVNPAHAHWWSNPNLDAQLYPANLAGVDFVNAPEGWREHDTARAAFRVQWCETQGVPAAACGSSNQWSIDQPEEEAFLINARLTWCAAEISAEAAELQTRCVARFNEFDQRFFSNWAEEWRVHLALLPPGELSNADLRKAILNDAQMQGANLFGAQMQGANLSMVQMQGATLEGAQMQGAYLNGVQMSEETDLTAATLRGAAVRSVDDTTIAQLQAQDDLADIFHPDEDLDYTDFDTQWRAFAATLDPPVTIAPDYRR